MGGRGLLGQSPADPSVTSDISIEDGWEGEGSEDKMRGSVLLVAIWRECEKEGMMTVIAGVDSLRGQSQ